MQPHTWKWLLALGSIIFVFILIIFLIVLHYKNQSELTKEKMSRIIEERDDSINRMLQIEQQRSELEIRNTEILLKLKEREEVLSKTLTELTRLSRETDEKINHPPALDIDAIGSWIKNKIGSTGTP